MRAKNKQTSKFVTALIPSWILINRLKHVMIDTGNAEVCEEDEFSCGGVCHPLDRKCDGVNDCQDGSDEVNCDNADPEGVDHTEPIQRAGTEAPFV